MPYEGSLENKYRISRHRRLNFHWNVQKQRDDPKCIRILHMNIANKCVESERMDEVAVTMTFGPSAIPTTRITDLFYDLDWIFLKNMQYYFAYDAPDQLMIECQLIF